MSGKSNAFETQFLNHLFVNAAIANVGDATGLPAAATVGNFFMRLYTSAVVVDDATIGTEASYTGYVSGGVAIPRTVAGFTVTGDNVKNAAVILFGLCTAGTNTIRYAALWKNNSSSVVADRLFWGTTGDLIVSASIAPEFPALEFTITEQ